MKIVNFRLPKACSGLWRAATKVLSSASNILAPRNLGKLLYPVIPLQKIGLNGVRHPVQRERLPFRTLPQQKLWEAARAGEPMEDQAAAAVLAHIEVSSHAARAPEALAATGKRHSRARRGGRLLLRAVDPQKPIVAARARRRPIGHAKKRDDALRRLKRVVDGTETDEAPRTPPPDPEGLRALLLMERAPLRGGYKTKALFDAL